MTLTLLISGELYKTWELEFLSENVYERQQEIKDLLEVAIYATLEIRYKEPKVFYWQVKADFSKIDKDIRDERHKRFLAHPLA